MSAHRTTRQGFTLIELLVVISIIAILAGLLLPAVTMVKGKANQTDCGNNQKQIVTAMIAYSVDYDGEYPKYLASSGTYNNADASAANGHTITKASMQVLAIQGSMPAKVFKCRASQGSLPTASPGTSVDESALWWGGATLAPIYAYDWTVGGEPASYRIVLADRADTHKGTVMHVAVDGSVRTAKGASTAAGANKTDGVSNTIQTLVNKDAAGNSFVLASGTNDTDADNIYDTVKDGPSADDDNGNRDTLESDARRAWVK